MRAEAAPLPMGPDRRTVLGGIVASAFAGAMPGRAAPLDGSGPELRRGINLSHWFAQSSEGYGADHLARFVGDGDLAAFAHVGFTHVRLPVEPSFLFGDGDEAALRDTAFQGLETAIERTRRAGLSLVLDLHPVGSAKNALLSERGAAALVEQWRALTAALVAAGLGDLTLEVLNEPEPANGTPWWALQKKVIAAMRSAGATGWIIANGGGWSGVEDLAAHEPYPDRRLVYTVHCYAPLLFTHQGADWTWDVARDIAGVGWPLGKDAAASAGRYARSERARGFLERAIAQGEFGADALERQFDRLADWAERHGAPPVYVGEFGVYAPAAPAPARLRWIEAVRKGAEARGWGWALWDASPGFGLATAEGKVRTLDSEMLGALGLRAA